MVVNVVPFAGRANRNQQNVTEKVRTLAALDIGSSKISCAIATFGGAHASTSHELASQLRLIGLGQTASRGIRFGSVTDIGEAERAIRVAVDAAERSAGTSINAVYLSVSGGRPVTGTYCGFAPVATGTVSARDVDNAVVSAIDAQGTDRRLILNLHGLTHELDGVPGIENPIGLSGDQLKCTVAITNVDAAFARNLSAAVGAAHLDQAGLALSGYASAMAVITQDESELGCIVIDIGSHVTSLSFIQQGKMVAADTIAVGGQFLTHDIAHGLTTSVAHAERMKTLWGSAVSGGHDDRDMLVVPLLGEVGAEAMQRVSKGFLNNILRCRLEEILELCGERLMQPAFAGSETARVVLTGGTSQLAGLAQLAQAKLGKPARLGRVAALAGLSEHHRHGGLAAVVGSLVLAANPGRQHQIPKRAQARLQQSQLGYARKLTRWLAEAL